MRVVVGGEGRGALPGAQPYKVRGRTQQDLTAAKLVPFKVFLATCLLKLSARPREGE